MRSVNISNISQIDLPDYIAAIKAGPIWVRVDNKLNRWYGSVGQVDCSQAIADHYSNNSPTLALDNYLLWKHTGMHDNTFAVLGMGKKIKLRFYGTHMVWLDGYTGPPVYAYTKTPLDNVDPQYDMMGTEITENSFVVTGSGSGSLQIAKISRLFTEQYGNGHRVRAEIEVLLDNNLAEKNMIGYTQGDTATVDIGNILVLTETLLEEFMLKRLSA